MNNYPWLDEYLLEKPGAVKEFKAEWGWMRYLVCGRQFAATCQPGSEHKEHAGREMVLLKCEPELAVIFREQYPDIVPGFYSNKQHWNSVYLDGALAEDMVKQLCDRSYSLITAKLTKKQRETLE